MTTTIVPAPLAAAVCAVLVAAVFGALAIEHCAGAGRRVMHGNDLETWYQRQVADGEGLDQYMAEERAS